MSPREASHQLVCFHAKDNNKRKNGSLHTAGKNLDSANSSNVTKSENSSHALGHLLLLIQKLDLEAVQGGAIDVQKSVGILDFSTHDGEVQEGLIRNGDRDQNDVLQFL